MRSEEPCAMAHARALFTKSEKSQEYTERVRYFEDGIDWLTELDGSQFEFLAAKIKKRQTDKLIEDTPSPVLHIIKGLFDRRAPQWFEAAFHPEDIYNAHGLIRALDSAL